MGLTFAWFWLVKFVLIAFLLGAIYKFYKSNFKSKFWMLVSGALAIFIVVQPVKLGVDTKSQTDYSNRMIKQSKELPPKIEDDTFQNWSSFPLKFRTLLSAI